MRPLVRLRRKRQYARVVANKDQQVKHVVVGVALGVLAQGVDGITSAKVEFELGFAQAWREWPRASRFPSIGRGNAGNLFWLGVQRSSGRQVVCAAWSVQRWAEPHILYEDWSADECLDLHADECASAADWKELGRLYVATFKPDQVRMSAVAE